MKTRTLLLLAVSCGLIILVAGGIQLLRLADHSSSTPDLRIGSTATAADFVVTVVSATEANQQMRVVVRTKGVDDPAAYNGFQLLAPPLSLHPVATTGDPQRCSAATVAEQTCTLVFDTSAAEQGATARVLLLRRGEDQHRWSLA